MDRETYKMMAELMQKVTPQKETPEGQKFHIGEIVKILDNKMPELNAIKDIFNHDYIEIDLRHREEFLRKQASELFNTNQLFNYYIPVTEDTLLNIMLHGNNLKEYIFKK